MITSNNTPPSFANKMFNLLSATKFISMWVCICLWLLAFGSGQSVLAQWSGNTCSGGGNHTMTVFGDWNPGSIINVIFTDNQSGSYDNHFVGMLKIGTTNILPSQTQFNSGYPNNQRVYFYIPTSIPIGATSFTIERSTRIGLIVQTTKTYCFSNIRIYEPLVVNSSAYTDPEKKVAGDSLATAYGAALATQTVSASGNPAIVYGSLGGSSITTDIPNFTFSNIGLFFVSPGQINFLARGDKYIMDQHMNGKDGYVAGLPYSWATVQSGNGRYFRGRVRTEVIGPGLLSANGSGSGIASAVVMRIQNGVQSFEPIYTNNNGVITPIEIDLGPPTDQVWLLLYGTGFRNRESLNTTICTIGGVAISGPNDINYAGSVNGYPGLDQANVLLPRSLIGRKLVNVTLRVTANVTAGAFDKTSNAVQVSIK